MPKTDQKVTSREYKLILSPDRFKDRDDGVAALRELVKLLMRDSDFDDQDKVETRRTWYLDTTGFDLRKANYALRVRYEKHDKEFKTTLKHRSPDRYISAAQNVDSLATDDRAKFEEDILPRFRSVFSKSNSVKSKSEYELRRAQDAIDLFPGLKKLGLRPSSELGKVNGFEAHEKFCKLCKLRIPKQPDIKVGLSFWYLTDKDRWPLIAECAFDYDREEKETGDKKNKEYKDFPLETVTAARKLFLALQNQPGWFNLDGTTKTRYVYEGLA